LERRLARPSVTTPGLARTISERVKTRGALPTEDATLVLLFGLVVSGQIRLRRLDGWRQIPAILREHRRAAA